MSQDLHQVNITFPMGTALGTSTVLALAVPGTAYGGGLNLVKVYYSCNNAVGAGSEPTFKLVTLNSTGAVIATVGANGSAALSAGTPVTGTISTYWIAGTVSFLGVKFGHAVSGAPDNALTASISYYHGRGSA